MPRLAPVTTATGCWERAGVVTAQSPRDCRKETHVAYLATDSVTASFTPSAGRCLPPRTSKPIIPNGPWLRAVSTFLPSAGVRWAGAEQTVTRGTDEQAG